MNNNGHSVGVVMLGGLSSRMGRDKSELNLNGQTLTQCAVDTLKKAGLEHVFISSGNKPNGIKDKLTGLGPLGGIHAVMNHESTKSASGFVFLPVDMPHMTAALIKALVDTGSVQTSACQIKYLPMPCYLPNTDEVVEALELALNQNKLAVKYFLRNLNAIELQMDELDQDVIININTPEQWSKYKQSRDNKADGER